MSEPQIESLKAPKTRRSAGPSETSAETSAEAVVVDYEGKDHAGHVHRAPWVISTPAGNVLFTPGANIVSAEELAKAREVKAIAARFESGQLRVVSLSGLSIHDLRALVKRTTSPDALEAIRDAEQAKPSGGRPGTRRDTELIKAIESKLDHARRNAPPPLS